MIYKDKETIKQVTHHQFKSDTFDHMTDRQISRIHKRWLKEFRIKIPDKIWWDSLNDNDKTEVTKKYNKDNLKELMVEYPGDKVYIRETKLSLLI
jgi:hypothetical protein